ncbi:hypothetical protein PybrP1_012695 [[Pythium] brassicae (nom. inval.)]|nr:hypothetical protein PybrP1_012695 [[Pythium] brassicae (nom. inval.)]
MELLAPSAAKPPPLARRQSALDAERAAVEQQVERDHQRAGSARKRGDYLPLAPPSANNDDLRLRDAKRAIQARGTSGGDDGVIFPLRLPLTPVLTPRLQTICAIHQRYERRRAVENAAFALAIVGIGMVFVDNEYTANELSKRCLRAANGVVTLALLGLVGWRFVLERAILIQRNVLPPHVALWRMPKQVCKLLGELLICAIFVPPGVSGSFQVWEWKFYVDAENACPRSFTEDDGSCYTVYSYPYEVLGLLSLLRLYMLPRVIRNLSDFTNYRTSYLGVVYHVDTLSSLFAVKCFLRSHPFKFLFVAFASTLVLTAYALAIVESPVNPNLAPLWNSVWLVALTMGTIGYGDLAAVSIAGQLLLVFGGMLAGILLVGVLSAAIFGFLHLDERDLRFVSLLRRQEYNRRLKRALTDKLFKRASEQRAIRKQEVGDYSSASTELRHFQDHLLFSLRNDHSAAMERLAGVEKRLDALLSSASAALSVVAASSG